MGTQEAGWPKVSGIDNKMEGTWISDGFDEQSLQLLLFYLIELNFIWVKKLLFWVSIIGSQT